MTENDLKISDFLTDLSRSDDGGWVAHFVELPNVSAFGDTPAEALYELGIAWELMKESYEKHGEPIPLISSIRMKAVKKIETE